MITFKEWKSKAQYFEYKNHPIAYWTAGKGPALVLIHGFPTASWDWYKVWESLTQHFTVYACDMIGFGYSAKPRDYNYGLTDQARLHDAFIKQMGITKVHLLVHDYGVSVAQELIASYKARGDSQGYQLLSCSFLNGGLFPELHHARLIQKLMNSPIGFILTHFLSKKSLRKTFNEIYGDKKPNEQDINQFYSLMTYNDGKAIIYKLMRYINDRKDNALRWKNALIKTEIPLQFINGPLDPISGATLGRILSKITTESPNDNVRGRGTLSA